MPQKRRGKIDKSGDRHCWRVLLDIRWVYKHFTWLAVLTPGIVNLRRKSLEVSPYDKWSDSALPEFQVDERFMPSVCELKDGSTSRPNLLTEADRVGLMDKNRIGELPCRWPRAHEVYLCSP